MYSINIIITLNGMYVTGITLRDRENEELKIATCKIDQHAYKWLECF